MATFEILTGANVIGGDGSSYLVATVELTDAQIKALPTTSIQILPNPGTDKAYIVFKSIWIINVTIDGYTNIAANGSLYLGTTGGNDLFCTSFREADSEISLFFDGNDNIATASQEDSISPYKTITSNFNNEPMYIYAYNAANGNYTSGNAANTLKVTVYYVVVDL